MTPIKLSASIMCANWLELKKDLDILKKEPVDFIHYDIMDGYFVDRFCLGYDTIHLIQEYTNMPASFHLMVEEPIRHLKHFEKKTENDVISIHYEACRNLHRDLIRIKQEGFRVGLVLNPATAIDLIDYVVEEVDMVTIMTVNPGYKGQQLVPQMIKKIERLHALKTQNDYPFDICVDGNVNLTTIPEMVKAGATVLVGGSSGLFIPNQPLSQSIKDFKDATQL